MVVDATQQGSFVNIGKKYMGTFVSVVLENNPYERTKRLSTRVLDMLDEDSTTRSRVGGVRDVAYGKRCLACCLDCLCCEFALIDH